MSRSLYIPLLLLTILLCGCARPDALEEIQKQGKLQVVSRNSPTTWFIDKSGPVGFEYALASRFADHLGVEIQLKPAFSLADIFTTLARNEAHFAAAGLSLTGERQDVYPHSVPYYEIQPQVIYRAGTFRPRSVKNMLDMDIVVLAGSSHERALQALRDGGYPDLQWRVLTEPDSMELLEEINEQRADLALLDSNEFEVQQRLYPRLKVAFDLGSAQDMVWYLPPDADNTRLLAEIDVFLEQLQADGSLQQLREEHFGNTRIIPRIGSHTFTLSMERTLPKYRDMIEQVAQEFQMDWPLLAAIAYQESHWDPTAESPTGVRGMMMLTLPTAREMGVSERTDPLQSLRGGARYYKTLKRRLPDDIYEPDRSYMALAAYNIGRGHLSDARVLTERMGGDPHLWEDVLQYIPLLEKSRYFETLRYGYARGQEAATYVQNIRHYQGILAWQDIAAQQPLPPTDIDPLVPEVISAVSLKAL
ncbi:membrane-bound lytic murein transglycosylase MltF [Halioglobus maricola]|uniref:Membrane-bound lytic murein transglycosylase F n=1 Tax=Halioglobus maricola TaxID=2601894 RepID=A0A5P9NH04_9GAMM|nr:membrane-bound lytic murein transglycosylase MltF [Halioglobus maricola]QFU75071.1 membrane-bound lytic murein transglycosylase MltF [Halioglobus maricola]